MPNFLRISENEDPEEDVVEHAEDGVDAGSQSAGADDRIPFVLLVFIAGELLEC